MDGRLARCPTNHSNSNSADARMASPEVGLITKQELGLRVSRVILTECTSCCMMHRILVSSIRSRLYDLLTCCSTDGQSELHIYTSDLVGSKALEINCPPRKNKMTAQGQIRTPFQVSFTQLSADASQEGSSDVIIRARHFSRFT